jgi:hypothetical protein
MKPYVRECSISSTRVKGGNRVGRKLFFVQELYNIDDKVLIGLQDFSYSSRWEVDRAAFTVGLQVMDFSNWRCGVVLKTSSRITRFMG